MDLHIQINGTSVTKREEPIPIHPGRPNTLIVQSESIPPAEPAVQVIIIAPDGRSHTQRENLGAHGITFDLGPFAVPAHYEYENGVVYRRGYQIQIRIESPVVAKYHLSQGLSRDVDDEWFFRDGPERVVYNDGYIPPDQTMWNPLSYSGQPMDPPVQFCLSPAVLNDVDILVAKTRIRPTVPLPLRATLHVRGSAGKKLLPPIEIQLAHEWQDHPLTPEKWPEGHYTLELSLHIGGKVYDGPRLIYRRKQLVPGTVRVSPLAPFTLVVDHTRKTIEKRDLPRSGTVGLDVVGWYAIFAEADGPCGLQISGDQWLRRVTTPQFSKLGPAFVSAIDLTGKTITVIHDSVGETGLRSLHFVPVDKSSVNTFRQQVENPPLVLRGINDWWCDFPVHLRDPNSLGIEEFDRIMQGQREIGLTILDWALGRSSLQYHSTLSDACMFPCKKLSDEHIAAYPWHETWRHMIHDYDAWDYPLSRRDQHDMKLYGWLCMNRHYGAAGYNGIFQSPWRLAHPELSQQSKEAGKIDQTKLEYFFEETRRERLSIFEEAVSYGPDGITVGCCRQPPMVGYNQQMVAAYIEQGGEDPRSLDAGDGDRFQKWLQWRADAFTEFMRKLNEIRNRMTKKLGRRLPIAVRVPDEGLNWCLAGGMDVAAWLREGLVDELLLDPLDDGAAQVSHNITEYVTLCRQSSVTVFGGVNATTGAYGMHGQYNPVAGLRRALGVTKAGVAGIEIYEAETLASCTHERWLVPIWANPGLCEEFLRDSNLDAVFPIVASNAILGLDNHSFLYCYSLIGKRGDPLPRGVTALL